MKFASRSQKRVEDRSEAEEGKTLLCWDWGCFKGILSWWLSALCTNKDRMMKYNCEHFFQNVLFGLMVNCNFSLKSWHVAESSLFLLLSSGDMNLLKASRYTNVENKRRSACVGQSTMSNTAERMAVWRISSTTSKGHCSTIIGMIKDGCLKRWQLKGNPNAKTAFQQEQEESLVSD